jgi:hypothetical protein
MKKKETANKRRGNISIEIRRAPTDLSYLSMDDLAYLVDKPDDPQKDAALGRDANEFKPMRDAVAHTALLTQAAKDRLKAVRENIKARVRTLLERPVAKGSRPGPGPGRPRHRSDSDASARIKK